MILDGEEKPAEAEGGWLLLMHQLPARPAYLRVKVWRSLREAGAVALRHSGYVLPRNGRARAVMGQIVKEIERGKGQAALCEARFVDGVSDGELRDLFNAARDREFSGLEDELRKIDAAGPARGRQGDAKIKLEKASQRLKEIVEIDFFNAKGRKRVERILSRLAHSAIWREDMVSKQIAKPDTSEGKVWVTRQNIHIDRIACAWLIRRFIDPKARFKFVTDKKYRGRPDELRYDMTGAEFTHEGDHCSFETLLNRFDLSDPALRAIGEIIHDLDLQDGKFERPETSGLGHSIDDIVLKQRDDLNRIAQGTSLFDDVYESFRARRETGSLP